VCQFDLALLSTFTDSKVEHLECMAKGGMPVASSSWRAAEPTQKKGRRALDVVPETGTRSIHPHCRNSVATATPCNYFTMVNVA
jgi:hypothetical protein